MCKGEVAMDPVDARSDAIGRFPTETEGLPVATRPAVVDLVDGDTYELAIGAVCKQIDGSMVRMLAYSGSIPGPTLQSGRGREGVDPSHEPR